MRVYRLIERDTGELVEEFDIPDHANSLKIIPVQTSRMGFDRRYKAIDITVGWNGGEE